MSGLDDPGESARMRFDGGCACRSVRFRMSGRPRVVHCRHCRRCQGESGTAFALHAMIEADRVMVFAGAPEAVTTPSANGKGQRIWRCPTCRVAVWSNYGGGGDAVRFVGAVDEPDRLPSDSHIDTASKQPWVVLPAAAVAFTDYDDAETSWSQASLDRRAVLRTRLRADKLA